MKLSSFNLCPSTAAVFEDLMRPRLYCYGLCYLHASRACFLYALSYIFFLLILISVSGVMYFVRNIWHLFTYETIGFSVRCHLLSELLVKSVLLFYLNHIYIIHLYCQLKLDEGLLNQFFSCVILHCKVKSTIIWAVSPILCSDCTNNFLLRFSCC